MRQPHKNIVLDLLVICLLFVAVYGCQLGSRALINPEEARYSSIAHTMLVTGNYTTPMLKGVTFLEKPPMYYWMQASAIKMFGYNSWALRFWPSMVALFGCLLLYSVIRDIRNRRAGLLAAAISASGLLYYSAAHYADMTLEISVFLSSSLLLFLWGLHHIDSRKAKWCFWSAFIMAGISFLTKGLMGIVFPTAVVGLWVLLSNQWRLVPKMRLPSGLILFLLVITPWLYFVSLENAHFLYIFFWQQQFQRFTQTGFNNVMPFWFYIPVLVLGLSAWAVMLVPSVRYVYQQWRAQSAVFAQLRFLLCWAIFVLLFFSIPASKIVGYILPVIPALAIIIAYTCDAQWSGKTTAIKITAGYAVFWLVALVAAGFYVVQQPIWLGAAKPPWWLALMCGAALLAWLYGIIAKRSFSFFVCCTLVSSTMFLLGFNHLSAKLYIDHSTRSLVSTLPLPLPAETKVVSYYTYLPDFAVYTHHPVFLVADWPEHVLSKRDTDMAFFARKCAARLAACPLMIRPSVLRDWWESPQSVYALVPKLRVSSFVQKVGGYRVVAQTPDDLLLINHKPKIYSLQK
jgi:hypothetical protein